MKRLKIKGFTLIELLIANVLGILLILVLLSAALIIINNSRILINNNRLVADFQSVLNLMTNDIRRAGYWSSAVGPLSAGVPNNNPFMQLSPGGNFFINNSQNCILFTYDRGNGGPLPTSGGTALTNDHFGYRLNTNNNTIEAFTTDNINNFNCFSMSTDWLAITDSSLMTITAFTITPQANNSTITLTLDGNHLRITNLQLVLTGYLTGKSTSTINLTQTVHLENDYFNT